jgi:hypothetical protein
MFQKGNQFGSKSKRGKSKFNTELKEYLGDVSNNIINEINIKELTNYERIQFLRTILPYIIPKNKEVSHENIFEEQPLFDVQIIDTTETKQRLDRFEKYAKENNVKLKDF